MSSLLFQEGDRERYQIVQVTATGNMTGTGKHGVDEGFSTEVYKAHKLEARIF